MEKTKEQTDKIKAEKYKELERITVKKNLPSAQFIALLSKLKKAPLTFNLDKEFKALPKRITSKTDALVPGILAIFDSEVNNIRLRKGDYIGTTGKGDEEKQNWKRKGSDLTYEVLTEKFKNEMGKRAPSHSTLQSKILTIAVYEIEQEANRLGEFIAYAKAKLPYSKIAKYLGYGDQIKKTGKVYQAIKSAIISGANTTYSFSGKKNGHYYSGGGSVYNYEDTDNEVIIDFNGKFRTDIVNFVNYSIGQFFPHSMKEIEDLYTLKKSFLHSFYRYLKLIDVPVMWGDTLKKIGTGKAILDRPQKCFERFCDCMFYWGENPIGKPEIGSIVFYDARRRPKKEMSIKDLQFYSGFKSFKKILKEVDTKDIRQLYYTVKKPHHEATTKQVLTREVKEVATKIVNWLIKGGIYTEPKVLTSQCIAFVQKKGVKESKEIFEQKANGYNPNVVKFYCEIILATLRNDYIPKIEHKIREYRRTDDFVEFQIRTPEEKAEGEERKRKALANYNRERRA